MTSKSPWYRVLDLPPAASEDEIRRRYRELVKAWHPDRFSDDPERACAAEERTKAINSAYETAMAERAAGASRPSASRPRSHTESRQRASGYAYRSPPPEPPPIRVAEERPWNRLSAVFLEHPWLTRVVALLLALLLALAALAGVN